MHQRRRSGIKNQNTINRRTTTEKDNSDYLLGDFDVLNSNGMKLLRIISPQELTKDSILAVCLTLKYCIDKPLPRDYIRRKSLLIKWLDSYYDLCLPYIQNFSFEFRPAHAPPRMAKKLI